MGVGRLGEWLCAAKEVLGAIGFLALFAAPAAHADGTLVLGIFPR